MVIMYLEGTIARPDVATSGSRVTRRERLSEQSGQPNHSRRRLGDLSRGKFSGVRELNS